VKLRVLGSAAGGGFPQWNCNCRNCAGLRAGKLRGSARSQSSVVVSGAPSDSWALVNASPDVLAQLRANPDLQPARSRRDTALAGIVLVDGQVDHTAGLLMLRESTRPWPLWCTDRAFADLTSGNPILHVLEHYCGIDRRRMPIDGETFVVPGVHGVRWRALPVAGKPAPYSPHREEPRPGDNVALLLTDETSRRSLLYAPGLAAIEEPVWSVMQEAACVLVDGTFWSDEEMIELGISGKRARDMGHLPQSGPGGMLEWLALLPESTRKILIHVNNTNPVLDEASAARAELVQRDIEVAHDGLEVEL
jgi:pyrroloquinoline quinone biosynthesis protein B